MNSEENFVGCNKIRLFGANITALTKTLHFYTCIFFFSASKKKSVYKI